MFLRNQKSKMSALWAVLCLSDGRVPGSDRGAKSASNREWAEGQGQGKIIVSRNGDLIKVKEQKTGTVVIVSLIDGTKIQRNKGKVEFFRHSEMDVTAMVPGLTIEAEGVGNANGQLEASKITITQMNLRLK